MKICRKVRRGNDCPEVRCDSHNIIKSSGEDRSSNINWGLAMCPVVF